MSNIFSADTGLLADGKPPPLDDFFTGTDTETLYIFEDDFGVLGDGKLTFAPISGEDTGTGAEAEYAGPLDDDPATADEQESPPLSALADDDPATADDTHLIGIDADADGMASESEDQSVTTFIPPPSRDVAAARPGPAWIAYFRRYQPPRLPQIWLPGNPVIFDEDFAFLAAGDEGHIALSDGDLASLSDAGEATAATFTITPADTGAFTEDFSLAATLASADTGSADDGFAVIGALRLDGDTGFLQDAEIRPIHDTDTVAAAEGAPVVALRSTGTADTGHSAEFSDRVPDLDSAVFRERELISAARFSDSDAGSGTEAEHPFRFAQAESVHGSDGEIPSNGVEVWALVPASLQRNGHYRVVYAPGTPAELHVATAPASGKLFKLAALIAASPLVLRVSSSDTGHAQEAVTPLAEVSAVVLATQIFAEVPGDWSGSGLGSSLAAGPSGEWAAGYPAEET